MNLRKTLGQMNTDAMIAIGAKDGHSYMYFGPAGDIETIETLFEKYLKRMKTHQRNALGALSNLLSEPLVKEDGDEEYMDKLLKKVEDVTLQRNRYISATKYVDQYVPVMNREVKDKYRKKIDNHLAILVEGLEQGEFWTKEEYDRKHNK